MKKSPRMAVHLSSTPRLSWEHDDSVWRTLEERINIWTEFVGFPWLSWVTHREVVWLEAESEAEHEVGGAVRVVVQPQCGGRDWRLVDVPLQAGHGPAPVEAAVEAESVPRGGRGWGSGQDGGSWGDGCKGSHQWPAIPGPPHLLRRGSPPSWRCRSRDSRCWPRSGRCPRCPEWPGRAWPGWSCCPVPDKRHSARVR